MDHDDHTLVEAELPPYLDMGLFLVDLIDKVYEQEVKVFQRVEEAVAKALNPDPEPVSKRTGEPDKVVRKSAAFSKGKTNPSPKDEPLATLQGSPGLLTQRAEALKYQRLLALLHLYYQGTSIMFGINPAGVNPSAFAAQTPVDEDDLYEPPPLNPKKDTRMN